MTYQQCLENFKKNLDENIYYLIGEDITLPRYKIYFTSINGDSIINRYKYSKAFKTFIHEQYAVNKTPFLKQTNKWVKSSDIIRKFKFNFKECLSFNSTFKEYLYTKIEKQLYSKYFNLHEITL